MNNETDRIKTVKETLACHINKAVWSRSPERSVSLSRQDTSGAGREKKKKKKSWPTALYESALNRLWKA